MNAPAKNLVALERSTGELVIRAHNKGHGNALAHLMQDGCLKARFPKMHDDGPKRGVLINTSGGIADGDVLTTRITVENSTRLALTTQAAERFYRARHLARPAQIQTQLNVGRDAILYWLPQETIAFDGSAAHRGFDLNIAKGGTFIGGEMMVLGRTAMKEKVTHCNLFDRWRIRYADKLVYADGMKLPGNLNETSRSQAQLADMVAYASMFFIGNNLKELQDPIRTLFEDQPSVIAGASIRDPVLMCRLAATDSKKLIALICKIITQAEQTMTGNRRVSDAVLPRWIF